MLSLGDTNMAENEKMPDVVYHYTSIATMIKIVESKKMWATSISYLNDTREREGFLAKAVELMPELAADPAYDASAFADYLYNGHTPVNEVYALPSVASFSLYSDSLPQWRSYCSQGNGVSIGFDVRCLQSARVSGDLSISSGKNHWELPVPVTFREVTYVPKSDSATVKKVLRDVYEKAKNSPDILSPDPEDREPPGVILGQVFRVKLEAEAATYKDISFKTEGEYRLIAAPVYFRPTLLHFRATRSSLVPYLELAIPSSYSGDSTAFMWPTDMWDAIRRVTIGPSADKELTARSVREFFRSKEMKVTVRTTDVSYRDW
jgi:hypothetical protein